ncbi:Phosphatidylinositol 3-kinase [Fasciola hepatica]|uniref:Phosphatidylinositol 3-kinase catalytic subunit type 3 n=2 Tax=Fasciola TaxID=6191 RepID=A0A4E0R8E1_FASHE|nr:Phosphatidylinositol 3-kinase [Fasciola hepatica]
MDLSGFHPEKFRTIDGVHSPLACYGELKVSYCITRNIPRLNTCIVSAWFQTHYSLDGRAFNETVELPFAYNSLYDYNGVCFVLSSTYTDEKGVHEQLLAGANMPLYNSKKNGIYELELHPLQPLGVRKFEDLEKVVRNSDFDAKPKNMEQMNKILKTNRKHMRNELFETPLDRYTIPDVARAVEEAKRTSGRLFLSVKFEFSRSSPNVTIPVIFERKEIELAVSDSRADRWNPVDEKYFKMTRNLRTADVDRKRKPNKETLDRLKDILDQPPPRDLSETDGDMIWQYRFYLADKFPEASLAKFLLAVRWEYPVQVDQAVELLQQWPVVSPEYVLELLNRQFVHPCVRRFSVARLQAAKDEDLLLYLYQLVQALHYENWHEIYSVEPTSIDEPNLPDLYIHSGPETTTDPGCLGSTGDVVDKSSSPTGTMNQSRCSVQQLHSQTVTHTSLAEATGRWSETLRTVWKEDLVTFLLRRAQSNFRIANYLYWFVGLEARMKSSPARDMYTHVLRRLLDTLRNGNDEQKSWYTELMREYQFVETLRRLLQSVTEDSGDRLRKSSRRPAFFSFIRPENGVYKLIFKHGDDLRQDQLVLQMVELMDVILRKENFDLKLTPYKVLATGTSHGFVQFIESTPLLEILKQGTLLNFLQQSAPSPTDPLGVEAKVMETYIRSLAGYCVITYLLGVGDRHMENILLTNDGRLFHIDFGFLFGKDPKLMAPEVRLTRNMIEAMGGPNTSQFGEFWKITFTAFLVLRRHTNLFLTLFSLVTNAEVRTSQDQINACEFLKERFCTNQTEERAINRLASRMTESIKAIVPDIMERIHTVMQYMRT